MLKKVKKMIQRMRPINVQALHCRSLQCMATTFLLLCFLSAAQAGIIESAIDSSGFQHSTSGGTNSLVTSPVRAGSNAFKHYISAGGKRAEYECNRVSAGGTYWYGYSFYHPSSPAIPSSGHTITAQWFIGGRDASSWPCGGAGHKLGIKNGEVKFDLQYSTSGGSAITCKQYILSSFNDAKDKWVDVVIHAKWTANTDGFVKLWVRVGGSSGQWVQKINYSGRSQADGSNGPYFKFGAYTETIASGSSRTVYTDEYRLGDSAAHFAQVAPGGDTPTQYESENATRSGATTATDYSGYTGSGFVKFGTSTSQYVQFDVYRASSGAKYLDFRFSNGSTANKPMEISVNGTVVASKQAFNPTGSNTTWATSSTSTTVNLNAGKNTVKVRVATSAGGPNIDNLKIR
jgi:hypothetical protein